VKISSFARDEPINGASRAGPDRHAEARADPARLHVVARNAQVAARGDLRAGADAVPDAHGDRRDGERLDRGVHARERLHAREAVRGVELLGDVGARRQRVGRGRGDDQDAQVVVACQLAESVVDGLQQRAVERVALRGTVEAQHLDPAVEALAQQGRVAHGAGH